MKLVAPGPRNGFPFIVSRKAEYWDGSSKTYPVGFINDSGDYVPATDFWMPAPSVSTNVVVGPNTSYPLGLPYHRAVDLIWRAKTLKAQFTPLGFTVPGLSHASDHWTPGAVDHGGTWGSVNRSVGSVSSTLDIGEITTSRDTVTSVDLLVSRGGTVHGGIVDISSQLPFSSSHGDGVDQEYVGNSLWISASDWPVTALSFSLNPVPVFYDGLYWFNINLPIYIRASGAVRADFKTHTGLNQYDYTTTYASMQTSRFVSLCGAFPMDFGPYTPGDYGSAGNNTVEGFLTVPFTFSDGYSIDCTFLGHSAYSSGPWTSSVDHTTLGLDFPAFTIPLSGFTVSENWTY